MHLTASFSHLRVPRKPKFDSRIRNAASASNQADRYFLYPDEPLAASRAADFIVPVDQELTFTFARLPSAGDEIHDNVSGTDGIAGYCSLLLSMVPEVQRLYMDVSEDEVLVWSLIPKRDREVRERVYERQAEIMDRFPDLDFSFHVISSSEDDPDPFEGAGLHQVFCR